MQDTAAILLVGGAAAGPAWPSQVHSGLVTWRWGLPGAATVRSGRELCEGKWKLGIETRSCGICVAGSWAPRQLCRTPG